MILDAGCFMRGMKNLWDNGGTVANFANLGIPGAPGLAATDFGPNQIGIRKAHMPSWSLSNTQLGIKLEGQKSGVGFSLNALTYRSQLPSLRGDFLRINALLGGLVNTVIGELAVVSPRLGLLAHLLGKRDDDAIANFSLDAARDFAWHVAEVLAPLPLDRQGAKIAPLDRLAAAFGRYRWLKVCVVVDEDFDVHDPADVGWAVATRSRLGPGLLHLTDVAGFPRDPHQLHTAKVGIDATIPLGTWDEYARKRAPGQGRLRLEDFLGRPSS